MSKMNFNCEFATVPVTEEEKRMVNSAKDANFFLRKRYFVMAWSFFGQMILFILRVNVSICIVDMTSKKIVTLENTTYIQEAEYSWTPSMKGLVLSSFSWGYLTAPLTLKFVQKFGGGNSFNYSVFITGILTILSPFLIQSGVYVYMAGRFLEGMFEAAATTALFGVFASWVPSKERSRLMNFCTLGRKAGVIIGYPICGYLSHIFNWKYVFYITGASSFIWCLIWYATIRNSPYEDFFITESEKSYLQSVNEPVRKNQAPVPWRSILKSPQVLAYLNEIFVQSWSVSFTMYCFPLFIKDVHDVSMDKIGILTTFPQIAALISKGSTACLQDHLRNKGTISKTKIHKICILFGQIAAIILLILTGLTNDFLSCMIILCLFKVCFAVAETSYTVLSMEMTPHFVVQIEAFVIFGMSIGYLLNPIAMGFIVANHTYAEWNHYFWFLCIFNIWGLAVFARYGSAETPSWASVVDG